MDFSQEFKKLPLLFISFLIIACGPSLSKEQKRKIDEFKRYVKENRTLINIPSERFGIPIIYPIVNNYSFLLKWVIRQNADVNVKGKRGETPLHRSIISDHTKNLKIISILIESGANVNSVDNYRNTPLHTAANLGKVKVANLLISHGADVNARANSGETPLHYAARLPFNSSQDRIGAAKLLLRSGANINKKDHFGRTPLLQSSMVGNIEMTEFLLKEGADANLATESGESPLHIAAASGHSNIAGLLIDYGAKVNYRNNEGITPLNRALHFPAVHYSSKGSAPVDTTDVVQVLREFGGIE
jgi:ankyrin repeat protein